MNVQLTPEQEQIVNNELKLGHFRTAEEVISRALDALRGRENLAGESDRNIEQQSAVREMLDFAERNRTQLRDISVTQLIHEGHRL